ncbi:MAG: alpha/beta fold hydrolase [Dehalococcoidia bacterium]|nr:alpha/beta fold hydrolase [Dehalococcoidia bacterium]
MRARTKALLPLIAIAAAVFLSCGDDEEATPTPAPLTSEKVSFHTEDGITIRGHLFGDGDVAVILCHMRPSDQTSWYPFAEELADAGYAALTFDFRGYGESDGEQELSLVDLDVEAALRAMRERGHDTVYLVGASMGGTASLMVAAREEVAGVVAISAPAQFEGLNAEEVIAEVGEPKLFIAAEGDASATTSLETLFELAPEPKEQRVFGGSAHGTALLEEEHAAEVKAAITSFLSR